MLSKALITTLLVGSSSVALAHPVPVVRDHRVERRWERPRYERYERSERFERFERPRWERPRFDRHEWFEHREHFRWRPIVRERYVAPTYYVSPTYVAPSYVTSPFMNGQLYLGLGGAVGNSIELYATGGATYVQQVAIQYTDGRSELVSVGQTLDANNPAIELGTEACGVSGVVVYGSGSGVQAVMR